ncbi:nitroreductase family protein [Lactobacillus jensenii]|uniref:nitroreductase family protein n=1 Tax=Lactobacillus jensenii TaxID=109790 RepID=UPI00202AD678|nr:nitroreductase family protein [Lactobacillus jensenii]
METKQAIEDRHSVRVFTNKDVEVNKLKGLVKLAQKAPSWVDSQPWKIYLVRGKSLAKLKELHLKNSKTDRSAAPGQRCIELTGMNFQETTWQNLIYIEQTI